VVRDEDDDGLLPGAVQHVQDLADLVVEIGDVGEIGAAGPAMSSSVMSKLRQSLASKMRCEWGSWSA
jgi:hypothetical protein